VGKTPGEEISNFNLFTQLFIYAYQSLLCAFIINHKQFL